MSDQSIRRQLSIQNITDLSKVGGLSVPHVFYSVDDFIEDFKISSGTYSGSFSSYVSGKIVYYFSSLALEHIVSLLCGEGKTDYILPYLKNCLDNVVINRADSTSYTAGTKIATASRIAECTSSGTSASSVPGAYATSLENDTITDGTAEFIIRPRSLGSVSAPILYGEANYFMEDINDGLVNFSVPDSHDAYATSLLLLIGAYEKVVKTGYSWTSDTSTNRGLTYRQIIDGLYESNIRDQFNGNLVYVFQNARNPGSGVAYDVRFTHDNCVNLGGLRQLKEMYQTLGDSTKTTETSTDIAKIVTGIQSLWNSSKNRFDRLAGENADEADGTLAEYLDTPGNQGASAYLSIRQARWLAQVGVLRFMKDEDLTPAQRQAARAAMSSLIPDRWTNTYTTPNTLWAPNLTLEDVLYEVDTGGDLLKILENIHFIEKTYLTEVATHMVNQDMAILLKANHQYSVAGGTTNSTIVTTPVSGDITLDSLGFYLVDTSSGDIDVTLPNPALFLGETIDISKTSASNVLNIIGTINGSSNLAVTTKDSNITLFSIGASWRTK